jgi:hypothetical protein
MDTASFVSPVIVAVRRKNASAANGVGMSAFARSSQIMNGNFRICHDSKIHAVLLYC